MRSSGYLNKKSAKRIHRCARSISKRSMFLNLEKDKYDTFEHTSYNAERVHLLAPKHFLVRL
jgi:hypothetical protein